MTPGSKIGEFEILGRLGAGGMGEVYRARDTRLGRDVAIKILPAAVVADVVRLERLSREARLLASLNHPNIAAIYAVETAGPVQALILELVEGETLGARLRRKPLTIGEARGIARQIASATRRWRATRRPAVSSGSRRSWASVSAASRSFILSLSRRGLIGLSV